MIGEVNVKVKGTPLRCIYEFGRDQEFSVYKVEMFDMDITPLIDQLNVRDKVNKLALDALGGLDKLMNRGCRIH